MKKIISTLIAAATILLVFLSVQGDTEELSASADSNVVISASAADQPFFNPAADSPDSATLDILLSWVATRENKAALKKQYTDKGFYAPDYTEKNKHVSYACSTRKIRMRLGFLELFLVAIQNKMDSFLVLRVFPEN